jgi:thioredoxin 1
MSGRCAPGDSEVAEDVLEGLEPYDMATDNVQTFTDGNFDETVLKSGGPVLVDFWAEWCGPCKRLAPTVDALASEYAGKVSVGKLNVDENPNVSFKYQVRGIPTLLLFKGGQVVETLVGLAPKEDLKKAIDKHIGD